MSRWRFWSKEPKDRDEVTVPEGTRTATHGGPIPRPAPARPAPPPTDAVRGRKIAELKRRRAALSFDLEQGELALQPDNPWQQRIALLDESLATVAADRQALDNLPPAPFFPVPPTPITDVRAAGGEPAEVAFRIGDQTFDFAEEVDWAERGGAVVRGQLGQRGGDAATLVPAETPPDLRDPLAAHLVNSVVTFATDLRDRALASAALPAAPTLADLAQPCPDCGGWKDWTDRCAVCVERGWQRQQLLAEAERLRNEQAKEDEERHRWAERLPGTRRRLADIEAELTALGG